jgi:hypothetical protein
MKITYLLALLFPFVERLGVVEEAIRLILAVDV